ncbi:MAG: hypothetical protein ACOX5Q_08010 [Bacillota bacterium]|jgi:hypothetical protein
MQPQKIALLCLMLLGVVQLVTSLRGGREGGQARLRILIKASGSPQPAEGLIRYLLWELTFWRGLDVRLSLVMDEPCEEMRAVEAILLEEGLLEPANDFEPDLVFVL